MTKVIVRPAQWADVPAMFDLILALAEFEALSHEVTGSAAQLADDLFGDRPYLEAIVATVPADPPADLLADLPADRSVVSSDPAPGLVPDATSEVTLLGDRLVGQALFFPTYSTFLTRPGLYLEDLVVLPEFRRQGIGTALLRAFLQTARDRGCARAEWSVLDWNQGAIEVYRSIGAEILPDWRTCRVVLT